MQTKGPDLTYPIRMEWWKLTSYGYYFSINLTAMVSPTARHIPAVNPTKQEIQQAQLQRYLLYCVSEPLQLMSAQSNARA